jgi:type IV pilus assembly protein PilV
MLNSQAGNPRLQNGATLIEALVSILILSLGLLGMAGLQLNALAFQKSSWAQHRISELTTDIIEKMQTNPVASNNASFTYTQTYAISAQASLTSNECRYATSGAACTPNQIANDDLALWLRKAQQVLPGGAGSVSGSATAGFIVTAMYLDKDFRDPITNTASTSATCTATSSGNAWRTCCPASAEVPAGVRCARTPFYTYITPNIAVPP